MGKELDQQEIDLVAVRVNPGGAVEMVLQQGLQAFFAGQARGLQELAQLMDLDLLVHFEKPLAGLLDRLLRRIFHAGFQVGARGQFDHKLAPQSAVQRMEQARFAPLRGQDPAFSVSESWFHDPVGDFLGKAGSDRGASAGILQRHHGGFGVQRAVGILQPQPVGKLQRQGGREQHFTRRTELDHRAFGTRRFLPP